MPAGGGAQVNRRSLLRAAALAPVAAAAASLGIKATPAAAPAAPAAPFGMLHYQTALDAGVISRASALEQLGVTQSEFNAAMEKGYREIYRPYAAKAYVKS